MSEAIFSMKRLLQFILFFLPLTGLANKHADTFRVSAATINSGETELKSTSGLQWKFTFEDDLAFALPHYQDTGWKTAASELSGKDLEKHKPKGAVWFRLVVMADSTALHLPAVIQLIGDGAASIYLDGKLLRTIGKQGKKGKAEYVQLMKFPAYFALDTAGPHLLAIRYENIGFEQYDVDSWGFLLKIDTPDNVLEIQTGKVLYILSFTLPLASLFFTLFLIHFLIFLFYRKEVFNLHFAIFNLSIALVLFIFAYVMQTDKSANYQMGALYTMYVCAVFGLFAISSFSTRLFSRNNIVYYIIIGLSLLCLILVAFTDSIDESYTTYAIAALCILSIGYSLVLIIKAIVTRKKGAKVLGFGILFFFGFIALVIIIALLNGGNVVTKNSILAVIFVLSAVLAIFSIPISISSYLAWRFADTNRNLELQLKQVETLSEQRVQYEIEKQVILENQKEELERKVALRTEDLTKEKQKSDELLLNILPHEIAEELKATGHSKAQQYDKVSVLFTDFVNFTQISELLGVDELLNELNINFTAFDGIMERYGMEKIKTIGDAYLAVSGLPLANVTHAQNAVQAAIDIVAFVEKRKQEVPYGLDIRIGINSGALIAGIIGVKKFAYDIWGDTVNIAARMEQSSQPGKINISESTYLLVKDDFACTYRGKIGAKNKGEMDMYFVQGLSAENK